jgi:AMP deaminase
VNDAAVKQFCHKRLQVLEHLFSLHKILNTDDEALGIRESLRDFYSIYKVDNHIHMAAAFTAKHLLAFVKEKCLNHGDDVVEMVGDQPVTLSQVMKEVGVDSRAMTVDSLQVQSRTAVELFHRFDVFNSKFRPFGNERLRTIFLKTENFQQGKYFAELSKQFHIPNH